MDNCGQYNLATASHLEKGDLPSFFVLEKIASENF